MRNWSEEQILAYCARKRWRVELNDMAEDFKKYDSHIDIDAKNMRLAKPPQVIEGGEKPMVKLTFAVESRSERHSTLWTEVTVNDRQSDLAAALEKGDVICWRGFPALRMWGDNNDKFSFEVVRAELFPSIELLQKLKERGWVPGAGVKKSGAKGKAAVKAPPARKGRAVQNLDDEDLEA
jgi:hypothetical protein